MKLDRKKLLRRQALRALDQASPYMLTFDQLLDNLIISVQPKPLRAELEELLESMEADGFVHQFPGEETKVRITDEGKAKLLHE